MENRRPPLPVIVVIVLVVLAAAYYGYRALAGDGAGTLAASGTIETIDVSVGPEIGGKVAAVSVDEGDTVETGAVLFQLDDELMRAQRAVAAASADSAQAGAQAARTAMDAAQSQYQIALNTALTQDEGNRLKDWFPSDPNQFNQPQWYFTRDEQINAAQTEIEASKVALVGAEGNLAEVSKGQQAADFLKAEQRLINARTSYLVAKDVNDKADNARGGKESLSRYNQRANPNMQGDAHIADAGWDLVDAAKVELNAAQAEYNKLIKGQAAEDLLDARAAVSVAQERYYSALDRQRSLETGEDSPAAAAAHAAAQQAEDAFKQAQMTAAQAQANLDLIDVQIAKLTVRAPSDGVVLTRNVEPGEFVQPGAAAVTMGNLEALTITVYVPEDRYGAISLGQSATVVVDSFPGQTFQATVSFISDQAEFTPRNVQTVEGRSSTVYAVKLKVGDPTGKLKPGMPADVTFK